MATLDLSRAVWRKSSRSEENGGQCVEVAFLPEWRKSSFSSGSGECVEVAALPDTVALRDSKNPDGPVLTFAPAAWDAFLHGVRNDEFIA